MGEPESHSSPESRPSAIALGTRLKRFAHRMSENALSFFFPPLCIICDKPRPLDSRWLCEACHAALTRNNTDRHACPRCSLNQDVRRCTCDLVWDWPYECIVSLFDFDENVQKLAHEIKYRSKSALAFDLAATFAHLVPDSFLDTIDTVVPIPLHPLKKYKRGYNQADRLARGFIKGWNRNMTYLPTAVRRRRYTGTQTKLDKEGRRKNLENAFAVPPAGRELLHGKRVALIDDVVTTGTTTAVCTQALLDAGCETVRVLSLSRD